MLKEDPYEDLYEKKIRDIKRRIGNSINELKGWKRNRDRKTIERAKEAGQDRPLTSDALARAIEVLEECKLLI